MNRNTLWKGRLVLNTYISIHPVNPQTRLLAKIVEELRTGGVIAIPTDSGYAVACSMGNKEGIERIRNIRQLDKKHNFSLLCHDFGQLGPLVNIDNSAFRTIKSLTPGPYTFILRGTKEVPRIMLNPKKRTVGVRLPDHAITRALIIEYGEPLLCSTLIMPGETMPLDEGWEVEEKLGSLLDVIVDGPTGLDGPTTVIDLTEGAPVIARKGAGSTALFD